MIEREFKIMNALLHLNKENENDQKKSIPVPEMYAFCEDSAILGTPFFTMEFVRGRIFEDPSMPGLSTWERRVRVI